MRIRHWARLAPALALGQFCSNLSVAAGNIFVKLLNYPVSGVSDFRRACAKLPSLQVPATGRAFDGSVAFSFS